MSTATTIIMEYICPALGILTANVMFAAPALDVQKAIARGKLGDLNPLPWAFMLGNTYGWLTYGILLQNLWVFFGNALGFLLSIWFNLAASKLLFQQQVFTKNAAAAATVIPPTFQSPKHDHWVTGITAFWMAVTAIVGFGQKSLSPDTQQLIVGILVNLNLVFFYGAPLSTIAQVLKTRNTASIHFWTMLTNTFNGLFWSCYGFAVVDYFIAIPNGLGALLGFVQFALYIMFPRGSSEEAKADTNGTDNDNGDTTADNKKNKKDEEQGADPIDEEEATFSGESKTDFFGVEMATMSERTLCIGTFDDAESGRTDFSSITFHQLPPPSRNASTTYGSRSPNSSLVRASATTFKPFQKP